jgi:hypothetical protein
MTLTSCYSMAPATTPNLIDMINTETFTTPTTITQISSSIYGSSSLTFIEDTQAYTTVEIDKSKVTTINSGCY